MKQALLLAAACVGIMSCAGSSGADRRGRQDLPRHHRLKLREKYGDLVPATGPAHLLGNIWAQAMIRVALSGYSKRILETHDINTMVAGK